MNILDYKSEELQLRNGNKVLQLIEITAEEENSFCRVLVIFTEKGGTIAYTTTRLDGSHYHTESTFDVILRKKKRYRVNGDPYFGSPGGSVGLLPT